MEQWYAFHTKPNAEYQVATVLQRRGFRTYLPEIESPKTRKRDGKKPFFPCYLFVRVDFEKVSPSLVQWTPGLRRIVAFDNHPVPLPDEIINLIRRKLGELKANGDQLAHPFKPGDTVRITDGPFHDMLAIFDRSTSSSERVQVLLNILGHASRVQLSVADLERGPRRVETPAFKRLRRTRGRGRRIKHR